MTLKEFNNNPKHKNPEHNNRMAPFNLKAILNIINEEFPDTIDKSELMNTLKKRHAENKTERMPTYYQLFVWEQMRTDKLKAIESKERLGKISEIWNSKSDKVKNDTKWYNKVLKARQDAIEEAEAKKQEKKLQQQLEKKEAKIRREAKAAEARKAKKAAKEETK